MIARKIAAISSASQRRCQARIARPRRPRASRTQCSDLPDRRAHHVPRPVRPDAADLGRDEAGVFERLFGDVVPELFLAHLREGLVGFHSGIARGGEPGEDLLEPQSLRGVGARKLRVFGRRLRRRPFPGRRRRAGRCRRRAPGRRRSRSARSGRARPRCGSSRGRSSPERAASRTAARSRRRLQRGRPRGRRRRIASRTATARYSGRDKGQCAEQRLPAAASGPRGRPKPKAAPARRPTSSVAASGSLISIPWYSSSAG